MLVGHHPSHPVQTTTTGVCRTADGISKPKNIIREDPVTGEWRSTFSTNQLVIATPRPGFHDIEKRSPVDSWNSSHKPLSNTPQEVRRDNKPAPEDNVSKTNN